MMKFSTFNSAVKRRLFIVWIGVLIPAASRGAGIEAQRIVVERAFAVLPGDLRPVFEGRMADLAERAVEPEFAWDRQVETRGRQSWHHLRLDAAAKNGSTSARLAAAEGFPREEGEARRLFKSLGLSKEGGRLPWAVADLYAELTQAFESGDRDGILAASGYITHFAWDASQPFSGSLKHDGQQTGNLYLGASKLGDRFFAHQSVEQRLAGELVRRYRNRYLESVHVLPMNVKPAGDPVEAVFAQMISAAGRLDDLLEADRQITAQLGAVDGESFTKREDEYYELLDGRCGEVMVERLEAAAMLSANLIAGAWERAGRPVMSAGTAPPERRAVETAPEAGSPPSGAPPAPQPAAAAGDGFVGSGKSAVYHRPTCEHAQKISASNLVRYVSVQEAESQGKRACRVCQPK
jgi:hypothetical protein